MSSSLGHRILSQQKHCLEIFKTFSPFATYTKQLLLKNAVTHVENVVFFKNEN